MPDLLALTAMALLSTTAADFSLSLDGREWTSNRAGWSVRRGAVELRNSSDNRLVGPDAPAGGFRWQTKLQLKAGRSAGILFGMADDGQNGYVARLDSRLGQLILAKVGPWPNEERIATFPWEPIDGASATLRIEVGQGTARVFVEERGTFPLLEARNLKLAGNRVGLYGLDAEARFIPSRPEAFRAPAITAHVPNVGKFAHIYDQSVGEDKTWYVNDHCLIRGHDGWHLYGITHPQPADPMNERNFAHGTSPTLLQRPWQKQPFALTFDPAQGENHLWAPHVIQRGDTYYMFYCAGSRRSNFDFRIHLATSKDLRNWTRAKTNPVFEDFYDARDPMVLLVDGTYYLYYTANLDRERNHHVVNVRTSRDLLNWSPARVAMVHPEQGTYGGPTESPFVVRYGDHFYLFVGPDGGYHATKVYRSSNPYAWSHADQIYGFPSHAAEVVQDTDGRYYATDSGWDLNGVFLAPLTWEIDRR
jgi:beta-fructofuranosidase